MSDIEKLWAAICKKWHVPLKTWNELEPQSQHNVVHAVNLMINVCNNEEKK